MKSRNELILERALAEAAGYLVDAGCCMLGNESKCRFGKQNRRICEKCIVEKMIFLARMEVETAERKGIHV